MKDANLYYPHWDKYLQDIRDAEERAVSIMIDFSKSNRSIPTEAEAHYVEYCFEVAGCNIGMTSDSIRDKRKIEAQCILRDCITRTNRDELRKIESALNHIVYL